MTNRLSTFISLAVLSLVMSYGIARRAPSPFRTEVDSISYTLVDFSDIRAMLGNFRTPVYPAFLGAADVLGVPADWRPALQGAVFALLVIIFWFGCTSSGLTVPQSFAATLPVAWSMVFLDYMDQMLPEILAAGLGFASLGLMLGRTVSGRWYVRESLLGVLMALAALTKPQYLVLVPVSLATLFLLWRAGHFQPLERHRRELWAAVGMTCGPLLAYSCLRLAVLGHFGIVSFGGANIAGLALNPLMFDETVVQTLPAGRLQDAGRAIVARRDSLLEATRNGSQPTQLGITPCPVDAIDVAALRKRPFFDAWCHAYAPTVYSVARPAVSQWLGHGPFPLDGHANVETDRILSQLSVRTIAARPVPYLRWLCVSCYRCLEKGIRQERWSSRLISALVGVVLVGAWTCGLWMLGRQLPLSPFQRWCGIIAIGIGCACFTGRLFEVERSVWGWISGFIAPVLFPATVFFAGVVLACARAIGGGAWGRIGAIEFLLVCFSLWAAAATFLFCAIEQPLDRYLMTVRPLLAAQCGVLLTWGAAYVTRQARHAWEGIRTWRLRGWREMRSA